MRTSAVMISSNAGFTLVELVMVMLVLGLGLGVLIPSLGGLGFGGSSASRELDALEQTLSEARVSALVRREPNRVCLGQGAGDGGLVMVRGHEESRIESLQMVNVVDGLTGDDTDDGCVTFFANGMASPRLFHLQDGNGQPYTLAVHQFIPKVDVLAGHAR